MRQLLLDLGADAPPTLDNFVCGGNAELLQRLQTLNSAAEPHQRMLYVWGQSGAGKSHLLLALAQHADCRYIHADAPLSAFEFDASIERYLLDDCERLSDAAQIAAFNLFNDIRQQRACLVAAGTAAPAQLQLRADLRTRLGWGLIYQLHELRDAEKIAALQGLATSRDISVAPTVLHYLLTHFQRDMRSLALLLDSLLDYALEQQRPVTLPLLRELLQLDVPADLKPIIQPVFANS